MGGPVAIGWRENGKTSVFDAYTGSISLLNHPKFYSRDPEHWARHIDWLLAEEPLPLAPMGYGLVFADFDSKSVFSCQNYSSPSRLHLLGAEMDRSGHVLYSDPIQREAGKYACLLAALRSGISPGAESYDRQSDAMVLRPWRDLGVDPDEEASLGALLDRISSTMQSRPKTSMSLAGLSAVLAPPGWRFLEIDPAEPSAYTRLAEGMLEAGLEFSASDAAAWNEFCADRSEENPSERPGDAILSLLESRALGAALEPAPLRRPPRPL